VEGDVPESVSHSSSSWGPSCSRRNSSSTTSSSLTIVVGFVREGMWRVGVRAVETEAVMEVVMRLEEVAPMMLSV
jgi:hypothetical protein